MHPVIENFLSQANSLHKLEPKNLPLNVLVAMSELDELELFKTCTYLFVLKNNVPTQNKIVTLSEDEIKAGATAYAKEIIKRIKE